MACFGGVGSAWHLAALAAGARTVQILPCAQCRDRVSLTAEVLFTLDVLAALGDVDAARRVGILPAGAPGLRRAVLAADRLTALVDGAGADRMPVQGFLEAPARMTARVAAWAVSELRRGRDEQVPGRCATLSMISGEGAPLGVLRAAAEGCTACGVCALTCPTGALNLSAGVSGTTLVLDPAICTGCGVCVDACPEKVLDVSLGVDLGVLARGHVPIARVTVAACPGCGERVPALPAGVHLTSLPAALAERCPRCRQAALVAALAT